MISKAPWRGQAPTHSRQVLQSALRITVDVCTGSKILDIIGDLALVGRPLRGHLIAIKPSHSANCEMARLISDQIARPEKFMQAFGPPPPSGDAPEPAPTVDEATRPTLMGVEEIMRYLPHRYPFLLVDRVLECAPGERLVAMDRQSTNT